MISINYAMSVQLLLRTDVATVRITDECYKLHTAYYDL